MSSCYIPAHERGLAKQLRALEDMLDFLLGLAEERARQEQKEQEANTLWKHTRSVDTAQRPATTWLWDSRVEVEPRTFHLGDVRIG